jgi:hypothetical protein
MDCHIESKPLIFHACQAGKQDEVTRGGDRKKLGNALDDSQKKQVK